MFKVIDPNKQIVATYETMRDAALDIESREDGYSIRFATLAEYVAGPI